jgi:cation transport ATPase
MRLFTPDPRTIKENLFCAFVDNVVGIPFAARVL